MEIWRFYLLSAIILFAPTLSEDLAVIFTYMCLSLAVISAINRK